MEHDQLRDLTIYFGTVWKTTTVNISNSYQQKKKEEESQLSCDKLARDKNRSNNLKKLPFSVRFVSTYIIQDT